ncbi:uncharacterized protein METZ01_LOCUS138782, partial [marine metagenome]
MALKHVHHVITRPGRKDGDSDVSIKVADELATVPGIPQKEIDVDFYSRNYPLESQVIEKSADREWTWTVYTGEMYEYRKQHDKDNKPLVDAAFVSGDIKPEVEPIVGKDVTEDIRTKARQLGFGEVGFTKYDRRYTYKSKKGWVKHEHAICLALEQDYWQT